MRSNVSLIGQPVEPFTPLDLMNEPDYQLKNVKKAG